MWFLPLRRCGRCIFNCCSITKQFYNTKNFPSTFRLYTGSYSFTRNAVNVLEPGYSVKYFSTKESKNKTDIKNQGTNENPSLFKRFKQMYRDYGYVMIPVHFVTSIGWFGSIYYLIKSGVDVADLLQNVGFSEKVLNPLKDSSMGYFAMALALYKMSSPIRYAVTIGGTTISINYLKKWGYIKPVPSKEKIKELYIEKRNTFRKATQETKEEILQRKEELKKRKNNVLGDYVHFKKELKDIKAQ